MSLMLYLWEKTFNMYTSNWETYLQLIYLQTEDYLYLRVCGSEVYRGAKKTKNKPS